MTITAEPVFSTERFIAGALKSSRFAESNRTTLLRELLLDQLSNGESLEWVTNLYPRLREDIFRSCAISYMMGELSACQVREVIEATTVIVNLLPKEVLRASPPTLIIANHPKEPICSRLFINELRNSVRGRPNINSGNFCADRLYNFPALYGHNFSRALRPRTLTILAKDIGYDEVATDFSMYPYKGMASFLKQLTEIRERGESVLVFPEGGFRLLTRPEDSKPALRFGAIEACQIAGFDDVMIIACSDVLSFYDPTRFALAFSGKLLDLGLSMQQKLRSIEKCLVKTRLACRI